MNSAHFAKVRANLRRSLSKSGLRGISLLREACGSNHESSLDFEAFASVLLKFKLTIPDIRVIFLHFNPDGKSEINCDEFVSNVRGDLSPARRGIISDIFDGIDVDSDGVINSVDIGKQFLPAKHPDCVSGKQTAAAILNEYMETFKAIGTNGSMTKEDFVEYFFDATAFITDAEFKVIMGSIWKKGANKRLSPIPGSLAALVAPKDGSRKSMVPGGPDDGIALLHSVSSGVKTTNSASFEKAKACLQKHIAKEGVRGMVALKSFFDEVDTNNDGTLCYEEFATVLEHYKLTNQEVRDLFIGFDKDNNESVDYVEFCKGVRGEMSQERRNLIANIFDGLDSDCDGVISCTDIGRCFVIKNHPDVLRSVRPAHIILNEFLLTFENASSDGALSKADFTEYYANTAAFIDDQEFEQQMNAIWNVPRGPGATCGIKNTLGASMAAKKAKIRKDAIHVSPKVSKKKPEVEERDVMRESSSVKYVISKLKANLKAHGSNGFFGLQRKFRILDDDGSRRLSMEEFNKGMRELKMGLSSFEGKLLFDHFDADGSGCVDFEEFIQGLRDPLSERRLALVDKAFDIIDKDGSGIVEPEEISSCYDAKNHPDVKSGKKTEDEVFREFLSTFDVGGVVDGMVTRQEFQNYYTNLGASIDEDDYFELMIRNAWHLRGGKGASESSANKRVLITDSKGKRRVVELENDLGLDLISKKLQNSEILRRLRAQGVDVAGVEVGGKVGGVGGEDSGQPRYKPGVNQKFSSAPPGVLPGTVAWNTKVSKELSFSRPADARKIINSIKEALSRRGSKGIVGLGRVFRQMDDNGNRMLDLAEFTRGIRELGVGVSDSGAERLIDCFDADGTGSIDYEEFVRALRNPLNEARKSVVMLAFRKLDVDGSGVIEPHELLEKYDASKHPEVLSGAKSQEEILKEFVSCFEVGGDVDGFVTKDEFLEYYENLGVSIDNDDYFELMVRNAWHISGGKGWCASSANKRVLVTGSDGKQKVVEVEDDLGLDLVPEKERNAWIMQKLKRQGVDVAEIDANGVLDDDGNGGGIGGNSHKRGNKSSSSTAPMSMSLGSQIKEKHKHLDPAKASVVKTGKPRRGLLFYEDPGTSVEESLGGGKWKTALGGMASSRGANGEADNGVQMILKSLKRQIKKTGGGSSIIALGRKFRIMDDSGDGELQFVEFKKAMKEMEFDLNEKDMRKIFEHLDSDGGGTISYEEFIQGIREPLSDRRKELIKAAFAQMDEDGNGIIEAHEVARAYDASKHPLVISGQKEPKEVLEEFLRTFDVGGVVDGMVTLKEFTNYYHNISANIFNEDYFELMIRNAWHIPGGKGSAANSANKRVLVTLSDGTQQVVTVENDLGLDGVPEKERNAEIVRRLKASGVEVVGVETKGVAEDKDVACSPSAPNPLTMSEMSSSLGSTVSFAKGGGALQSVGRSQIGFIGVGGGNDAAEDCASVREGDIDYRKRMGLSSRNEKGNIARKSQLGRGSTVVEEIRHVSGENRFEEVMERVREIVKSSGPRGIFSLYASLDSRASSGSRVEGLARARRSSGGAVDDDVSGSMTEEEIKMSLWSCGIRLSNDDVGAIARGSRGDGQTSSTPRSIIEGVRGAANERREGAIRAAFDSVVASCGSGNDGKVEIEDFANSYDAKSHPDVVYAGRSSGDVSGEFLDSFRCRVGGAVGYDAFRDYCLNVGFGVESDYYFELVLWRCFGCRGKPTRSDDSSYHVMAEMKDGSRKVVRIEGGKRDKVEAVRGVVRVLGVRPVSVKLIE